MIEILFMYQLARNPLRAIAGAGGVAACTVPRADGAVARNVRIPRDNHFVIVAGEDCGTKPAGRDWVTHTRARSIQP